MVTVRTYHESHENTWGVESLKTITRKPEPANTHGAFLTVRLFLRKRTKGAPIDQHLSVIPICPVSS